MKQIQMLWAPKTLRILFSDMTEYIESKEQLASAAESKKSSKYLCLSSSFCPYDVTFLLVTKNVL